METLPDPVILPGQMPNLTGPLFDFEQMLSRTQTIKFNEQAYLAVFDDVIVSLDLGEFPNAREHFETHGLNEGRLTEEKYIRALGLVTDRPHTQGENAFSIDTILHCKSGYALIIGWIDDRSDPLSSFSIFPGGECGWNTTGFGRVWRPDAEAALDATAGHLFGFWLVVKLCKDLPASKPWLIRGRTSEGSIVQVDARVGLLSETKLRSTILSYFAGMQHLGNREIECLRSLDADIGTAMIGLNRTITNSVTAGAWVSYYGPQRQSYSGSIIVCLFGKIEFFFLQSAFFSMAAGAQDYEFIYVSNSPELTEALEKEARICARIYGLSIVLVCLADNAGFGAANNVAARYARSCRLLIINPDVFPRDKDWATRHATIMQTFPADQTRIFGAPLYYDDGSSMHQGMYFEIDAGISVNLDGITAYEMIRTEHYGKGAPVWSKQFIFPRKVSAITGAFISIDRAWFEKLGGFNEDFLFGHYEDADLSLKSLASGQPVWMHDFPLWHMEGKGSTKRTEHEGGILVNRWLFTKRWGQFIASELRGPNPSCIALRPSPAEEPQAPPIRILPAQPVPISSLPS